MLEFKTTEIFDKHIVNVFEEDLMIYFLFLLFVDLKVNLFEFKSWWEREKSCVSCCVYFLNWITGSGTGWGSGTGTGSVRAPLRWTNVPDAFVVILIGQGILIVFI